MWLLMTWCFSTRASAAIMLTKTLFYFQTFPFMKELSRLEDMQINPLRPGDAYNHELTKSSVAVLMACHLYGPRPLPMPMKVTYWVEPSKINSVKFQSKYFKISSAHCCPFHLDLTVLGLFLQTRFERIQYNKMLHIFRDHFVCAQPMGDNVSL